MNTNKDTFIESKGPYTWALQLDHWFLLHIPCQIPCQYCFVLFCFVLSFFSKDAPILWLERYIPSWKKSPGKKRRSNRLELNSWNTKLWHHYGPGFDSRSRHHMWVEFPVFLPPRKPTLIWSVLRGQTWVVWRQPETPLYAFDSATLSCVPAIQPLGCKGDD